MHEFSLAQQIVEIVDESLTQNGASRAEVVTLEIGTLSGVEIPALELALESLKSGSRMADCRIKIDIRPATADCRNCSGHFKPAEIYSPCPYCGSYETELTGGQELLVKSITAV